MNEELEFSVADLHAELERRRYNKLQSIFPEGGDLSRDKYPKHMEHIAQGNNFRERLILAANRVGKTELGCYEDALHLTGLYPDWWQGKRFKKPVNVLVAGETAKLTRDSLQIQLLGSFGQQGTGFLPKKSILDVKSKSGVPDAVDLVKVEHSTGGISTLQFQSYDQKREAFQATARDHIHLDEEPPLSIYAECVTRTMTTKGSVVVTFTPLKGISETVQYLQQRAERGEIGYVSATWDDAPHLDEDDKVEMLKAFPPHQRDARSKGIPSLGSGAIYPVPESIILTDPFKIPEHWKFAFGMDVGWNATAVVWGAVDPDTDNMYIYDCYKVGGLEPSQHASAIAMRGNWIRGAIDPAARGRSQADGQDLLQMYIDLGLKIVKANNSVEAGIYEVWQRMLNSQLYIFSTCKALIDEYRVYRRDEKGRIVKENDHLMDALRYLVMTGSGIATNRLAVERKVDMSPDTSNTAWAW